MMRSTDVTKGSNENPISFTPHFVVARKGTYIVMHIRLQGHNHRNKFYHMQNVILKILSSISAH